MDKVRELERRKMKKRGDRKKNVIIKG